MSVIDTLVFDRGDGATYGAADMNRVGEAVTYVAARLAEMGISVSVSPITDWGNTETRPHPDKSDVDKMRAQIRTIRGAITAASTTPAAPDDTNYITVEAANAIEKILADCDAMITRMEHTVNLGWALGIADIGLYGGLAT